MNRFVIILLAFIMFSPLALSAEVTYTEYYCQDNSTLVQEEYFWNGTANVTVAKEFRNVYYGCHGGAEVKPKGIMDSGLLVVLAFVSLMFMGLGAVKVLPPEKHQALKLAFLLFSLVMSIGLIFTLSGLLSYFSPFREIILYSSNIMATIGFVVTLITVFVFFYFLIQLIQSLMSYIQGKKMDDDELTWD